MIIAIAGFAILIGVIVGPQLWVQAVLRRYEGDRPDLPGTGGEFARHVLDAMGLRHVKVEECADGDHYDTSTRTVRLQAGHFRGRSVTAVAVAAHEVGHAMQDATGYTPLRTRTRLVRTAQVVEKIGSAAILAAPLMAAAVRHPAGLWIEILAGLAMLAVSAAVHVMTLPVELDASFNRALPVLDAGRYLPERDMAAARRILRAAAFTYAAAALMSLINVTHWLRVLRF